MILSYTINFTYRSKTWPWARSLRRPIQIFLWLIGNILHYKIANTQFGHQVVFFLKTHTHMLCFFKTIHYPKHTYAGIVKSQLLRFYRICTRKEDFKAATKLLFLALAGRGYCRSFLRRGLKTFRQSTPICVSSLLPTIVNYSASAISFIRKLKRNFKRAIKDADILRDHRPIAAFRCNKNLK